VTFVAPHGAVLVERANCSNAPFDAVLHTGGFCFCFCDVGGRLILQLPVALVATDAGFHAVQVIGGVVKIRRAPVAALVERVGKLPEVHVNGLSFLFDLLVPSAHAGFDALLVCNPNDTFLLALFKDAAVLPNSFEFFRRALNFLECLVEIEARVHATLVFRIFELKGRARLTTNLVHVARLPLFNRRILQILLDSAAFLCAAVDAGGTRSHAMIVAFFELSRHKSISMQLAVFAARI